ncbi:MAG: SDR family NAD(P)-dependent oxidoreductase [Cyanobacteriota bacterium]|nr:SDR family NAD(P)-dependent oxidoreductase [Cyanobacteriota bacterium]
MKRRCSSPSNITRAGGKGIAIGLGEVGATIYITGRSLERPSVNDGVSGTLQETQLAIEKAGGKCIPVQVDRADDEQVRLLFERIENEQQGQLHILVNNVFSGVKAIGDAYGQPFWKSEPSLWDRVNNVGLRSHYISSVFASRMMAPRGGGIIFTISSWGGMSYLFGPAYGAGKAASDRQAADMAVELKADNIASISIWPGIVGTEHIINFTNQLSQSNTVDSFGDRENWETPLFIGRVIANLAAEASIMSHTGKVRIVAELAEKYNIVDENGNCPISVRSLRFLIPFTVPALRKYAWLIPNFKIPWFLLLWGRLISPQI